MEERYETKTIEHLGLVAGMFDELGVGELLDEVIEQDFEQRQVTVGQAVKAMVLNGLGFANRRLYLSPHFFANKPTEQLIGRGITPGMMNEDTLGKALDELHGYGVSDLYSLIAARAVKHLGLTQHMTTSPASTLTAVTTATKLLRQMRRLCISREAIAVMAGQT